MATNSEVIAELEETKTTLQQQRDNASGQMVLELTTAINNIAGEIGSIESAALANAPYVPRTDLFKKATDDGKEFLDSLKKLKTAFKDSIAVARALDSVIKVISKVV